MNTFRKCRAVLIVTMVAALGACSSHAAPKPAAPKPATQPSASASPAGSEYDVGYAVYSKPRGAPVPDLVTDGFTHVTKLSPKTSEIVGPAFGLTLAETVTTTTISGDQEVAIGLVRDDGTTPGPIQAPAGTEFVLVRIGPPPDYTQTGSPTDVTWSLQTGSQAVPLARDFGGPTHGFERDASIAVTVPTGADAVLSASEAGKTQSISLRTGKVLTVTGGSSASLRSGDTTFSTVVQLSGPGIDIPAVGGLPKNGYASLLTVNASLALNADGHPTAASGHSWLVLQAYIDAGTADQDLYSGYSVDLPLRTSLTVHAGGTSITVPDDSVGSGQHVSSGPVTWVVDVPSSITSVQVAYTFTGSFEQWTDSTTSKNLNFQVVSGRSATTSIHLN